MQERKEGLVLVVSNAEILGQSAADLFMKCAEKAVDARGRFVVALSGGSSPRGLYRNLRESPWREQVPWERTHIFWGDERCVPAEDPRSNARMALDLLLQHVPVPGTHIHALSCERAPGEAAQAYEDAIKDFFAPEAPCFDLVLLGLGENGHTASLFPGDPILDEQERLIRDIYVPEQDMHRVSFTAPLINQAETVAFLVTGSNKAQVLKEVLEGPYEPRRLPAQLIGPLNGELIWLLDEEGASKLGRSSVYIHRA